MVFLEDSHGRRTGANPGVPMSEVGLGGTLQEIPGSDVEETNAASDDPATLGQADNHTSWHIRANDGGPQSYVVVCQGISLAIGEIRICAGFADAGAASLATDVRVLVSPGAVRRLSVQFGPATRELKVHRIVSIGDLAADVTASCGMKLIEPGGLCQSLKAKADASDAALKRGNKRAATGNLHAFLNELKAQDGKHIQEPALTILREEAEALLNPPLAMPKPKKPKAVPAAKPAK
jgi:hypothetical protein